MSAQPGMESAGNEAFGVGMIAVEGKITTIDLAQGALTLDNGTQLSPPTSFQYTSHPTIGDQALVTYAKDGENKVVRAIDRETGGSDGSHGGD